MLFSLLLHEKRFIFAKMQSSFTLSEPNCLLKRGRDKTNKTKNTSVTIKRPYKHRIRGKTSQESGLLNIFLQFPYKTKWCLLRARDLGRLTRMAASERCPAIFRELYISSKTKYHQRT